MIALRQATLEDIAVLWNLRTRAIEHACVGHYTPQVLAAWLASPAPAALGRHIVDGGGPLPFYERAGFIALREDLYPHRSGIGIPSVFMEKFLG
ncbi:MAG: family N-acetyltransferase [Massilia sp.]|nr:family N-acetyltransferase [Massilia sp.]